MTISSVRKAEDFAGKGRAVLNVKLRLGGYLTFSDKTALLRRFDAWCLHCHHNQGQSDNLVIGLRHSLTDR